MLRTPINERIRVGSVISSLRAGGIGTVWRYCAGGLARQGGWDTTLISLHDRVEESSDVAAGCRTVCLGLEDNCARLFLNWLSKNPQDVLITSDVSRIESAYPFLPPNTRHIVHIHDFGRRYRSVALRYAPWIDAVACVAHHIENRLKPDLSRAGFKGLVRTVHNGANFPPLKPCIHNDGPLRLLFMGRLDPIKGVFDLVPLVKRLKRMGVPVLLNVVGGENQRLRRDLTAIGFEGVVAWHGHLSHEKCYEIAEQSDILLMASRKEPFGMVTIEAMSMGCVPMAYDVPSGSKEIIEHGRSGLLVPLGDIGVLAEEVRALSINRHRLAELSTGAIERARGAFSAEVMSRNIAQFIQDVLANARQHPAKREAGLPSPGPILDRNPARIYQTLPASLRGRIRTVVGNSPKLCYWWLNR